MASSNIILAVPSANSSVNYELPKSESAQLSFSPEDIDGIKLNDKGGLEISFVEGGQVTLSNFQSFIDNGNTLTLADGTNVDPKLLFTALGGHPVALNDSAADAIQIDVPSANEKREVTLEAGEKYLFNFDLSETTGADVQNGKMVIGFANGGEITVANYQEAMAGATPPELSLAAKTCIVSGDELITNIQKLAQTNVVEEIVVVEEVLEETKAKSKLAAADMDGADNSGIIDPTGLAYDVAKIEPAAGEADIARQLAQIETAAGPAPAGGRAGGYGFNSRPGTEPFQGKGDIGPINPTDLGYRAPELTPSTILLPNTPINPMSIRPGSQFVDETNLKDGPLNVSGTLPIDFGSDGPGGVVANGGFSSGGSQTNNELSSNGEPVTVAVVDNKYVGTTPDGSVVFELAIDPVTGNYTYTQYLAIDHADGTDPNDQIILNFGVTAYDGDGDSVSTTIQIVVADDAPEIEGDTKTVDETNLGPIIVTDTLNHNFNQDGPGQISATGSFEATGSVMGGVLSSSGVPITIEPSSTGYVGMAGTEVAFTLTINPATGEYTYTQYKNLDHADGNDPDDIITLTFGVQITDFDGDTATAPIVINIKDDAPIFQPPCIPCGTPGGPTPDKGLEIVDETNLKGGAVVETGRLDADFGGDTPGSYAFQDGSFTSSGSKTGGALTHNGVPVVVTLVNGEWIGMAGDKMIFKLELNTATGDYSFTLYDNLDHADKTDPDDRIILDFAVIASDFDGDSAAGSIRIIVKDDGPVANDDFNTFDSKFGVANGNVITGENGGPGAADNLSTDEFATGPANKVVKIAFEGNEVDVPETGTVSIDGQYGTLTISADGTYTYEAFSDGGMVTNPAPKEFVVGPALPDFDEGQALDPTERQSLGIEPGNLSLNGGETVTVTLNSQGALYGNTLGAFTISADGTLKAEMIIVKDGRTISGTETVTYQADSDAAALGFFIVADGARTNNGYPGIDFTTGTLNFVYGYGTGGARDAKATDNGANITLVYTSETGVETVLNGPLYFTSERGSADNLNADGTVRVVSGVPGDDNTVLRIGFEDKPNLGDKDFNDIVFDVSIKSPACGCKDPSIRDEFVYTIEDSDGDQDTAKLVLNGEKLTNDKPIFVKPGVEIVDETDLAAGTLVETGKIEVNFGEDGPGTIEGSGSFTSGGSRLNNELTSGGVPVEVSLNGNTYTGTANGVIVFTLVILQDGSYTYNQFKVLDHADGNNPNDIITLNFGIVATDCDGDKTTTTLTVKVVDDAPVAKNDQNSATENQTVTGNVTDNDVIGQDTPGSVTKVTFGNQEYDLTTGPKTIVGDHGTLIISSDGSYSYTANNNADGTDKFIYTLTDGDGDTATAKLVIDVTSENDIPVIKPAVKTLDETDLVSGPISHSGNLFSDFGNDGPGTISGNDTFTSTGSRLNDTLTSGGVPVSVSFEGNTYTGTANGVTVFTMTVTETGAYTFTLFEPLDHADGNNPNDIITLNFGVTATDTDGDAASTTITIHVKDDAPSAKDDKNSTTKGKTVTGNVTDNDFVGQDTPGAVTKVTFGNQEYDLTTGPKTIVGNYGTLVISSDGSYSYTANSTGKPNGKDHFVYTLRDHDGDTATAKLTIDVTSKNDIPVIKPSVKIVDETDLAHGTITREYFVETNFGEDGPGEVTANGSFVSGGSQKGGILSSGGSPVTVSLDGNTYTGTAANGTVVFTFSVDVNGNYSFKLYEQLDHADGNNPNDIITLDFGVTATDADGDSASTTVTVKVLDDAPTAKNDHNSATKGKTVTGNVTDNDFVGQDTPGAVTKVIFGNKEYDLTTGPKTITGNYGTLVISSDGSYSYTANSTGKPNGKDYFTYVLRDGDGDTATAKLTIDVTSKNDIPVIKPSVKIVDETDLAHGTITREYFVERDFGNDGPGVVTANGSFVSGGSQKGNILSSGGSPVTVALDGNTYVGTAANGTVVFTLMIASSGDYSFKLYEQLDHADGKNPNDIITLEFGVTATDADGDSASTTVTVHVKDDAPVAHDDYRSTVNGTAKIEGNVTDNDFVGQDTPGAVISISFGNVTRTVPSTGTVSIDGYHGKLTIDSTGQYSYTATPGAKGKDYFTYVLRDGDGDTDPAKLMIEVKKNPIVACIFVDDACVDKNGNVDVPVHAYFTGGNGNETMTVTMTGIPSSWKITAPGWVKVGDVYTKTFDKGVDEWNGSVNFKPPANSSVDLKDISFKISVYDPDTSATTSAVEEIDVVVGAPDAHWNSGKGGEKALMAYDADDNDDLYGGLGADAFLFKTISEGVDTLKDFDGAKGEEIDLSNIVSDYDPLTDAINDFVFATESEGGQPVVSANVEASGQESAHQFAAIETSNVNVTDMFNNGSIIV